MSNKNLQDAKTNKNDEFYTLYEDIEAEMSSYLKLQPNLFQNKIVYCPCDDHERSNFAKYFLKNFNLLGLSKLMCSSRAHLLDGQQLSIFDLSYLGQDNHQEFGKLVIYEKNNKGTLSETIRELNGDGSFSSEEVTNIAKKSDFIITNPPFSRMRTFLAWIAKLNKPFSVISTLNAVTYKDVFPMFKRNEIWVGSTKPKGFIQPDGSLKKFGNTLWITNIDHEKRHEKLRLFNVSDDKHHNGNTDYVIHRRYRTYDNFDAIDVNSVDQIPDHYDGVMGVPVSYIEKYCPEQFILIGHEHDVEGNNGIGLKEGQFEIDGKGVFKRILIKRIA